MTTRLKSAVQRSLSSERFSKVTTRVGKYLPKVEKRSVFFFLCMALIIVLASSLRLLPLQWSFDLSEFDPYFQYDVTRYIAENGFFSWQNWHMEDMWFPQGRDVAYTSFPALPMTGAALYYVISFLGFRVSVMDVCILFPVIFAVITCVVAYYFGKEMGGRSVGLFTAFFLAINPAYIGRTSLGFYDDETVSIFAIVLTSLVYLRALKHEKWQGSLIYSVVAGAGLGYISASWGASRYLLSLLALFTFVLFIAKMYSRRLLISYGTLLAVGLSMAVLVPKLGFAFLREFESVAAVGVLLLLAVYELSRRVSEPKRKSFIVLAISGLGVAAIGLWQLGFISLPIAKFISVLNPFERISSPIIESVQEHRPATWSAFYYQFGTLVFLAPLGFLFIFQKITQSKIYLTIYALTALYFSASMIRLTILLAPALCSLGALAVVEILRPFVDITTQRVYTRRRLRLSPRIGKSSSVLLITILFILTLLPLGRGIDSAYAPTTIASSSLPVRSRVSDWSEALIWMKENLPKDAVVASWWDYGYWISVVGDKISLADNGTFNGTQIAWLGRMFMSTEEDALRMMNDFNQYAKTGRYKANGNVSYVVVFTTIGLAYNGRNLWGDEVKWRWMAKIGWNNTADTPLEDYNMTKQLADYWTQQNPSLEEWYTEFGQTVALPKEDRVLTKLMLYGVFGIDEPSRFQLSFSSSSRLVHVYKVIY